MVPVVTILIVDDDPLVRAGLRLILGGSPSLQVVGEGSDGDEAVDLVTEHRPDVVLMDIRMPRVDGLEATRRLQALPEPPRIIVLTTFDSDDLVLRALTVGGGRFSPQGHAAAADGRGYLAGCGWRAGTVAERGLPGH